MDREKFIQHLKSSGIPFTDAELAAEADAAEKDAKAEERRSILNSTKATAPAVAESSPTIAKTAALVAAPIAAAVPAPAVISAPITGDAVERVAQNISKATNLAENTASNATQDSLDYARNAIANNPELTGALAAIPLAYGANKLGLFDNLGSKMSASAAPAQPFVGGSGPRVTSPVTTPTPQPQAWDIHSDPSFGNFLGDVTAPAATPTTTAAPATAPVNTKLQALQARAAAGTPATNEFVGPMQFVGPPEFIGPRRPVVPTPPEALASAETNVETSNKGAAPKPKPQLTPEQLSMKLPIGHGSGDSWLYNTLGPEKYHAFIQEKNNGKPFGDQYAAAQQAYQETYPGPKLPGPVAVSRKIARPPSNFGAIPPEMQEVGPPTKEALQKLKPVKPPKGNMANALVTPLTRGGYNPMTDNLEHALNPLKL